MEGLDHVAERLRHLVLTQRQVAVDDDLTWHLDSRRHQHGRPDDRVELEDVLADQVDGRRPELLGEVLSGARVGQRRVVVQQRVDPDVDHLRLVPRDGHSPLQAGAGQRYVEQAALDERERLVVAVLRRHEVGPFGVEALERLLKGGQSEEPVVLLLDLEHDLVDRAAVAVLEFGLGLEVGAARAVPALVVAGVDVPVVVDPLDHLGDLRHVLRVRRPDEEVVGDVHRGGELLEADGVPVAELPRRDPEPLGLLRHRLAVLVRPGQEEDVLAALTHVPREHVGSDGRVGVPEMGLAVHVVDRRGHVVRHRPSMLPTAAPCAGGPAPAPATEAGAASPRPGCARARCVAPVLREAEDPAARRRPAHASAQPRSGPDDPAGAAPRSGEALGGASRGPGAGPGAGTGLGAGGERAARRSSGRESACVERGRAGSCGRCARSGTAAGRGAGAKRRDGPWGGRTKRGRCRPRDAARARAPAAARHAAKAQARRATRGGLRYGRRPGDSGAGAGAGTGRGASLGGGAVAGRQHRERVDGRRAACPLRARRSAGAAGRPSARPSSRQPPRARPPRPARRRGPRARRGAGTRCRSRRRSGRSRSDPTTRPCPRSAPRRPPRPRPGCRPAPLCRSLGAARPRTGPPRSGTA